MLQEITSTQKWHFAKCHSSLSDAHFGAHFRSSRVSIIAQSTTRKQPKRTNVWALISNEMRIDNVEESCQEITKKRILLTDGKYTWLTSVKAIERCYCHDVEDSRVYSGWNELHIYPPSLVVCDAAASVSVSARARTRTHCLPANWLASGLPGSLTASLASFV